VIKSRVPNLEDQIDAFAARADGGSDTGSIESALGANAKRTFKAINVPFNEYEYSKLEAIINKFGCTKLYAIRQAIIKLADEIESNQ